MQNSEKKIDNLFQDKFADYMVVPPVEVWDKIEASLDEKKKKRRAFFIWGMSSAASLLLAFLGGWYFSNHLSTSPELVSAVTNSSSPKVLQIDNRTVNPDQNILPQQPVSNNYAAVSSPIKLKAVQPVKHDETSEPASIKQDFFDRLLNSRNTLLKSKDSDYSLVAMNSDNAGEDLSAKDRAIIEANMAIAKNVKADKKSGNWAVGVQASPAYRFNSSEKTDYALAGTSVVNQANSDQYVTNVMGGLKVEYSTGNRLSFQSGVSYGEVSQRSGKVGVAYSGHNLFSGVLSESVEYDNTKNFFGLANTTTNVALSTNIGVANIELPAGTQVALAGSSTDFAREEVKNYDFDQRAGYVEVPFNLRFMLIEQRMGLYVLGGLNTNILVSNTVALGSETEVVATGQIEGLNPLTFSSSLGLGFNYAITKHFNFSLEPMLKFQLTSLNSQSVYNSKPYTAGVFTGLSYSF